MVLGVQMRTNSPGDGWRWTGKMYSLVSPKERRIILVTLIIENIIQNRRISLSA